MICFSGGGGKLCAKDGGRVPLQERPAHLPHQQLRHDAQCPHGEFSQSHSAVTCSSHLRRSFLITCEELKYSPWDHCFSLVCPGEGSRWQQRGWGFPTAAPGQDAGKHHRGIMGNLKLLSFPASSRCSELLFWHSCRCIQSVNWLK